VAISATLVYLAYSARRDIPFRRVFVAFGAFIVACGFTHFMGVYTLWSPVYWLAGAINYGTAVASVMTAIALPPLVPRVRELIRAAKLSEERRVALERANDRLEAASHLKSQFLANASHELRTPLTSITGYVDLLLEGEAGELTPMQVEFLGTVASNARRQTMLIDDLLDLAKIESGRLEWSPNAVDLGAVADEVRTMLLPQAVTKGIELVVDATVPAPVVWADPALVDQVVLNLVANPVKFTEVGRVSVVVRAAAGRGELTVTDTGIGISPAALPHIFDEFRQADDSTSRRFGGTGLGLAIARHLAELQGGTIAVESQLGTGSSFTLSLPAHDA